MYLKAIYVMIITARVFADEKPSLQTSETNIWEFGNVTLTCSCPESTNSNPYLATWYLQRPNGNKSNILIQFNLYDSSCKNEYEFADINYTYHCLNAQSFVLSLLNVSRQLNGYQWKCSCGFITTKSNTITVSINVPVKSVNLRIGNTNISTDTTINLVNNYKTTLECSSTCAKPEASFTWYRDINTSTNVSNTNNTKNGLICSQSVLSFIPTLESQGKEIYCSAINKENEPLFSPRITVDVLYPPYVGQLPNISVIEGKDFKVSCNEVPGNPNKSSYYWSNREKSIISEEKVLTILNVSRKNESFFTCTVTNEMKPTVGAVVKGNSSRTFYLTVFFPTEIRRFSLSTKNSRETVVINKTDNQSLVCIAEANPSSKLSIANPRGEYITEVSNSNIAHHTLLNASYTNAGEYTCTGRNNYTKDSPASSQLILIVRCPPMPSSGDKSVVKLSTIMHVDVTLSFLALKYLDEPNKTLFTWFKGNDEISDNDIKYKIRTEELQTNISVRNTTDQDLGLYRVVVKNSVGEYVHFYELNAAATTHRPTETVCSTNIRAFLGVGAGSSLFTLVVVVCLLIGYKRYKKLKSSYRRSHKQGDTNKHKLSGTEESQVSSAYTALDKNKKEVNMYDTVNVPRTSSQLQDTSTQGPCAYIKMKDTRDPTKDTLDYININI